MRLSATFAANLCENLPVEPDPVDIPQCAMVVQSLAVAAAAAANGPRQQTREFRNHGGQFGVLRRIARQDPRKGEGTARCVRKVTGPSRDSRTAEGTSGVRPAPSVQGAGCFMKDPKCQESALTGAGRFTASGGADRTWCEQRTAERSAREREPALGEV